MSNEKNISKVVREASTGFEARKPEPANGLKVRKIGNSMGVVLPKELLASLGAKEGDVLFPSIGPDGALSLSVFDPTVAEQVASARRIAARYRNALRELAK